MAEILNGELGAGSREQGAGGRESKRIIFFFLLSSFLLTP
jgi:hypothetical protein